MSLPPNVLFATDNHYLEIIRGSGCKDYYCVFDSNGFEVYNHVNERSAKEYMKNLETEEIYKAIAEKELPWIQ